MNNHINITDELSYLFDYIKNDIITDYPNTKLSSIHFILAIIDNPNCMAHHLLCEVVFNGHIEHYRNWCIEYLISNNGSVYISDPSGINFDTFIEAGLSVKDEESIALSSVSVLTGLLTNDPIVNLSFQQNGVVPEDVNSRTIKFIQQQTSNNNKDVVSSTDITVPIKHERKEKKIPTDVPRTPTLPRPTMTPDDIYAITGNGTNSFSLEDISQPLSKYALEGKLDEVYGNDDVYQQIYTILGRRDKNNVIIVGDHGIGKTSTARYLAYKIFNRESASLFDSKQMIEINLAHLIMGAGIRGATEQRLDAIVQKCASDGNHIVLLDDIGMLHTILSKNNNTEIDPFLMAFLKEPKIQVVITCDNKMFKKIENSNIMNYLQVIRMEEPTEQECENILNNIKGRYEYHHDVIYDDNVIKEIIRLSKRYLSSRHLPDSAIDVLDEVGSLKRISNDRPDEIKELNKQIDVINILLTDPQERANNYEELIAERKKLVTKKSKAMKKYEMEKVPDIITLNDVQSLISKKSNIPVTNITIEDKIVLKGLEDRLKSVVIGQDQAINETCNAIKRKRVGIADNNKPTVLFFGGTTGTGKSYLAKTIAKEIYGSEKSLIRLDMAEYGDQTSINRLLGSSQGYVGYENGSTILNEVKKKPYCVLLLDEIEKAHVEVHNTLLQLMDEGRLTDNHGNLVDFRNVILIMTSNVGAKEAAERGSAVGFNSASVDYTESIIRNELKHKFKPEFLNRIDRIIYFNKLSDENIHNVIRMELKKIETRLSVHSYCFDDNMYDDDVIEYLYNKLDNNKDMGARPILRMLQTYVEDVLTEYIINNNVEDGFKFNKTHIINKIE